jgi:hypothetical protein
LIKNYVRNMKIIMQGRYWFFFVNQLLLFLLSIFIINQRAITLCILDCSMLYTDICYVFILIRCICIVIFDPSQLFYYVFFIIVHWFEQFILG